MKGDQSPALSRIDAAIARIEAAARRRQASPGDPALATRHANLRAAVAEALAELDAVIAAASA